MYFLCHPRTFFSFCHIRTLFLSVMFGLEPDISLTDSPVKPGNDEKEKKPGNDEKEKKRGMTIRRGEPAMTGGRESTNTAGEKNKPGVCKRSGEKCKAKGLLSLIRGFL